MNHTPRPIGFARQVELMPRAHLDIFLACALRCVVRNMRTPRAATYGDTSQGGEEACVIGSPMINVAVADRERLTAQALSRCINDESDMRVRAIYEDADHLIASSELREVDVIVLDPEGLSGRASEFLWRLRMTHPDVQIVVVTASQRERNLFAAVRAGARGFVSKYADLGEVLRAIRAVYRGEGLLSPEGAIQIMDQFARQAREETGLTQRQREVLCGIVQGKSNRQIGLDLGLAEKTVKNYTASIFGVLGVKARTEAAIVALQEGLVSEREWRTVEDVDPPAVCRHGQPLAS